MAEGKIYAGVELGGTKCVAILARGPDDILARETVATTAPDETLAALRNILGEWKDAEALGIASFGPVHIDPNSPDFGRMAATPKPGWAGADIAGTLQRAAGVPARLDTDVNGAALAEMRWGAGQGFDDFAYVTVGTGVGVGLIVNGQSTGGFSHGELGHIRVARLSGDDFQGVCPYHADCVESLASGPALKARIGDRPIADIAPIDPVWRPIAWTLAQLCHAIVCAAAPRAIVIGGGVVDGQPHLLPAIEAMLVESLNGYLQLPEGAAYVRSPGLGADAGPLGAIALAMTASS
jgi:fructokinase